jgi:3-dehydroquinate dehydratase-2
MARLLVIHGPNLNLLGRREPDHYGNLTLDEIDTRLRDRASAAGHELITFQSNAEPQIIERIQTAPDESIAYILINPAALTHTSIALRDALLAVAVPFIEIHLSNVHAREDFRSRSYLSDVADGVITGLGALGYELALEAAIHKLTKQ